MRWSSPYPLRHHGFTGGPVLAESDLLRLPPAREALYCVMYIRLASHRSQAAAVPAAALVSASLDMMAVVATLAAGLWRVCFPPVSVGPAGEDEEAPRGIPDNKSATNLRLTLN